MNDEAGSGTIHHSYCKVCAASCGVIIRTDGDAVVDVRGDPDHPCSQGYTCIKGRNMGEDHGSPHRLDEATLGRGHDRRVATTQEVVGDLATRIAEIVREFGPDAVGLYRGNSANKDHAGGATAVAFARSLGTKSFYSALTLDAVSKVVVSALMTGSSYEALVPIIDWERAPLVLIVGANPLVSHGHD
ncbi:MAG: molybdopterin oxidoreductase, partial [Acidimicrobiaceae bacterium]|nr:molybdopterin oxidoreductase [Acidimicrobiaceae bacterium]